MVIEGEAIRRRTLEEAPAFRQTRPGDGSDTHTIAESAQCTHEPVPRRYFPAVSVQATNRLQRGARVPWCCAEAGECSRNAAPESSEWKTAPHQRPPSRQNTTTDLQNFKQNLS
jgi:hypothetical protein